jgi:8-amino-7-oxononanoate synthase
VPVRTFAHHSPDGLRRALATAGRGRPVVVCDGFCPGCGRPAPLPEYLDAVRAAGGLLVVDDTQALGIFGEAPGPGLPYGRGGGGSLRRWGIEGPELLLGASLAKGFGAPLAALSGSRALVERFAAESLTRVHGSPPSVPAVRAAARALALNRARGDGLRERLAGNVERFRGLLAERGVRRIAGGSFPVQTLPGLADAAGVHARLEREGIRAVPRAAPVPVLTFLLRADHEEHDLARAACAVARAARAGNRGLTPCQP